MSVEAFEKAVRGFASHTQLDASTEVCAGQDHSPTAYFMSTRISDCPPLLEPGEHIKSIEEIREMCVTNFSLSTTRRAIMDGFVKIFELLKVAKIPCDLLVDGSFMTEEIEPEDIDFAVVVTPKFYESCTQDQRKLLDWIGDDKTITTTHFCDCYLCVHYRSYDPEWFEGICDRSWWVDFYSKSVVVKRIRGIAVVQLRPE